MAAAVSLLVFVSFFRSVLPHSFEQFKSCLPLYCANTEQIHPRPPHCRPFCMDSCDEESVGVFLVPAMERLYEIDSLSTVSLSFMSESKELQRQLNSILCQSSDRWNLTILQDVASHFLSKLILFKCYHKIYFPPSFGYVYEGCQNVTYYKIHENENVPRLPPYCSAVHLQVNDSIYDKIFGLLAAKISTDEHLRIECNQCLSEGRKCGVKCLHEQKGEGGNSTKKWLIVECGKHAESSFPAPFSTAAASVTAIGILVIGVCCYARKLASYKRKVNNDIKAFLRNYGTLAPKRYSYSEVKKMTRSFKDRLGQGGYGSVFKGKLPDGSLVAVKVLNNSKGDGAEFINEVASISRTSHVNIVTLLGFCFDGSKRALIYEFMPNGSLDKYIYNEENAPIAVHQLDCEKLNQIVLGIALGLEYLHRGCNTRIVHFDIKPHNILLDENFCPKISDFGLAKICPKRESNISLKDIARGTVGYIAPEVFCRTFGGVSHKSDVYSYGMLVLEMIGGRRSPRNIAVDNTSEIYFPNWIYKRIELDEDLGLLGINVEEENNLIRKLVLVSLWCIQTDPSNRPPVNKVVEMLQAKLESLPIPPRPCFSSPSKAPKISVASSPVLSSELLDS